MNKLYSSGNYIIILTAAGARHEIPKNLADYKRKEGDPDESLEIRERAIIKISITEIEAADWENNDPVPVVYTFETLEAFLQTNTANFSTVPGGSGTDIGYVPTWDGQKYILQPSSASNIGNADQQIDTPGLRAITLPGALSSDGLVVQNVTKTENLVEFNALNAQLRYTYLGLGKTGQTSSLNFNGNHGRIYAGNGNYLDTIVGYRHRFYTYGSLKGQWDTANFYIYTAINMANGKDFIIGSGAGSKIGGAASKMSVYGVDTIGQQVLATGSGATVDDVITILQNFGVCKQS